MKIFWIAKKNVVSRSIQQKETGEIADFFSPSKSDLGTSASLKITLDPAPQLTPPPSSSVKSTTPPSITELNPKKCKSSDSGSIYEQSFDALAWSKKNILPHSFINMDDVAIKSHLQLLARGGVQTIGICVALARELEKTPLGATQRMLIVLQDEVASLEESKKGWEEERKSLCFLTLAKLGTK
ncbi:hypothetical protein AHAS_Ahas20G0273600 [Arachis hypogaea]